MSGRTLPTKPHEGIAAPALTRRTVLRGSAAVAVIAALTTASGAGVGAADTDPEDFALPAGSSYVGQRIRLGPQQYLWLVDCGAGADDARGTLAPAFVAGGWRPLGTGLCSDLWIRDHTLTGVSQGSLGNGGYAHLVQVKSPPFSAGVSKGT